MAARARVFEFAVSFDGGWVGTSDRGGPTLPNVLREWTPEHLVLAGLARCSLTSLRYHADHAKLVCDSRAEVHGSVTRRDSDGRFAFVELTVTVHVNFDGTLEADTLRELLAKAERDCWVGASLTAKPAYHWIVDGEEIT